MRELGKWLVGSQSYQTSSQLPGPDPCHIPVLYRFQNPGRARICAVSVHLDSGPGMSLVTHYGPGVRLLLCGSVSPSVKWR